MLPSPLNKILHITGLAAHFPGSRFFGRVDYSWWDHSTPRSVGWVVGAYFMIRRETMEEIGYLDDFYFLYFEEVDFCIRARRTGWDVVFYPYAQVIHLGGQSSLNVRENPLHGMQINSIRIATEYKYYRKNYNLLYVLASAFIEFAWNCVIYIKNLLIHSETSTSKKNGATLIMKLIIRTLINDRFGKGKKAV
ncbi:MAG: glycosyltransferase family 2 protein [Deltaproteobacteria bacterium]|nr:glycosyltransferase family 2 protein [Deltaproteobacteria bacterium]